MLLFFVDDPLVTLAWCVILVLPGFFLHVAQVRSGLRGVTLPPEGAVVIDGRPNWFADEAVFWLVPFHVWMALLGNDFAVAFLGFPLGEARARIWEARRVDRFEREKRWRLLRPRSHRTVWSREYFPLPQGAPPP